MKKLLFIFAASILGMVACNDERVETTLYQGMDGISGPIIHEAWSDILEKCTDADFQWCDDGCKPCTEPPQSDLFANFNSAFTSGAPAIQSFFSNTDVSPLWPHFALKIDLIDGLSNGQKRIIKVTNQNTQIDYFLIGNTNLDENSIRSNPDYTISCSECQQ